MPKQHSIIVHHRLWLRNMVSEDLRKIIALVIVTLSYVSVPLLLFLFVVIAYFDIVEVVQYLQTRALEDAFLAISLAVVNVALFFIIWALVRWARQ